ncbi:putative allantoicase [Asanoa ishikariensis]|uniref:Probable allantoicase n=1 Tax=Asanoa ishikariensis TaxID=137265 RepID=A0A1H3S8E7_9ACTN|nr:allantoicase [Asanoa ishikariensis]GIF70341.1 putative allantoicase [Asanoa ishikariensis]SDZ33878.1 allantoicase [Asanoa ishikariensis]
MTAWLALPDLASRRLGGGVVGTNDELFAAADNLVTPEPPGFTPRTFGPKGQVYDGWETRRRRSPGEDWAIVRLGVPGRVRGVVVDTSHFTGNFPPEASVFGCRLGGHPSLDDLNAADWAPLLSRSPLAGDTANPFDVSVDQLVTHVKLVIHPDGGVARLRVHGEVVPDPVRFPDGWLDLAAVDNGGRVVGCSDLFYGAPSQLIEPGLARTMGEGWETRRRRDSGNDWVVVRLAAPGRIRLAELDTSHFKGNAPGAAALRGVDERKADPADESAWRDLLPHTPLRPDTRHRFEVRTDPVTHVRLDIHPDGGMARLRLHGHLDDGVLDTLRAAWQPRAGGGN